MLEMQFMKYIYIQKYIADFKVCWLGKFRDRYGYLSLMTTFNIEKALMFAIIVQVWTLIPHVTFAADHVCELPDLSVSVVKLQPECVYQQSIVLDHSGVVLDCQGATLDGKSMLQDGITIGAQQQISNVIVKNCFITRFKRMGIFIHTSIAPPANQIEAEMDKRYSIAPKNIIINNVVASANGDTGVFVGDHVTETTIENSTVSDNSGPGIYLEFSSRNNLVQHNRFVKNGWNSSGHPQREGLAIDSSAHNRISNNIFTDNGIGGIFLYKNCGERGGPEHHCPIRYQHSDYNKIEDNIISGQGVGVWVASRQSKDQSTTRCADGYYGDGIYARDYAANNIVIDNSFEGLNKAIVIEDDDNQIINNVMKNVGTCVLVGTEFRSTLLDYPVKGTTVVGNVCTAQLNAAYQAKFGSVVTTFQGNTVNNKPAQLTK